MPILEKEIIINKILIHYIVQSTKSHKTCLFLHGWRSDSSIWKQAVTSLPYNSYCIDLPGFGKSQLPPNPFTLGDYCNIVSGFINKLNLHNVYIVGHSFGGRICIKLASSKTKEIRKIILVDSAGFTNKSLDNKLKKTIAAMVKPIFKFIALKPLKAYIYEKMGSGDYVATPQLQKTFLNIIKEDLTHNLEKITQDTLIIWGEQDRETPLDFAYMMKNHIKKSKLMILKNATHFPFIDNLPDFNKQIIDFIKEN